MKFSSVTIYKDVERIHEVFTELKRFSDIDEILSGGKMALFKRITVGGLVTRWEMGYEKHGKTMVQIVAIDNGLEEVEFTLSDELEKEISPQVGDYVKVTLLGNWKKEESKKGKENEKDELVADAVKKAVELEVIGKYEFTEDAPKKKKKTTKKAKPKKTAPVREESDDELDSLFAEEDEVEVKLEKEKDSTVK